MLCVVRSKACKRCGGDLSLECDVYGVYIECIQCGANWNIKNNALQAIRNEEKYAGNMDAKSPPIPISRT